MTPRLETFRRVVLKVGSALLVDRGPGRLKQAWLAPRAEEKPARDARGAHRLVV